MSIRTLPDRGPDQLLIFLLLAVIIHLALAWGLSSYGNVSNALFARVIPQKKEPLIVDVVEMPFSGGETASAPKNFKYYSDKNRSFDKDVYPEDARPSDKLITGRSPVLLPAGGAAGKAGVKAEVDGSQSNGAKTAVEPLKAVNNAAGVVSKTDTAGNSKSGDSYKSDKSTGNNAATTSDGAPKRQITADAVTTSAKVGATKGGAKAGNSRPNLMLSNDKISELERKYEAEAPAGERGKTLQLNTSEVRYYKYLMDMKRRIEYYWEYPVIAARNGWQGSLNMSFTIHKDGSVGDVIVNKSSKYPVLDEAAVNAIKIAAPFSPFPADFDKDEITIKANFMYDIYYKPERN